MTTIIEKARNYAMEKHAGTFRKCNGGPYFVHPEGVARRIQGFPEYENNENMIAAAYLHDTVEDTNSTIDEIESIFNKKVAFIVKQLTSHKSSYAVSYEEDPLAKARYLTNNINKMSNEARVVKLADREDNVSTLVNCDPLFSHRYAVETEYILNHVNFTPNSAEKTLIQSIKEKINPYL